MFCALRQAAYGIIAIRQTGDFAKILSKVPAEKNILGLFSCEQRHTYALIITKEVSYSADIFFFQSFPIDSYI